MQWDRKSNTRYNPLRYIACHVVLRQSDPQPDSWLISDQIDVSKANRIDITAEYRITGCSTFPNNGGPYCDEKLDLYINLSDQYIGDGSRYPDPFNHTAAYEKVAEIRQPTNLRTSVTIHIGLVKGKHVILAFHNSGACTILYSVKVTYNACPYETFSDSLGSLPRTVAPANDSESIQVQGNCSRDAVQVAGNLYVRCQSNGEWSINGLEGRCICKEDMQNVGGKCEGMFLFGRFLRLRYIIFFPTVTDRFVSTVLGILITALL